MSGVLRARRWPAIAVITVLAWPVLGWGAPSHAQTPPAPAAAGGNATPPPLPGSKSPPAVIAPQAQGSPSADTTPTGKAAPGAAQADKPSAAPAPSKPAEPRASGDASSATELTLETRTVAILKGKSDWEQGFDTINASLAAIRTALDKAHVKAAGLPMTVFRKTDDNGFEYDAMVPVDPTADRSVKLPSDVAFGQSPAGKVLRFQHRGAYEEIDSTYEAITAYLDEKGFDTKNLFMEEYLNKVKNADDAELKVDIYVLIK